VEQIEPVAAGDVDLGAAIDAQVEPTGPLRTRLELSVDDTDVRAGNDDEVETERAQLLHQLAQLARIGPAVRNGSAVPVEDDRLEPTVESPNARTAPTRSRDADTLSIAWGAKGVLRA
jgi:hypothetical protein